MDQVFLKSPQTYRSATTADGCDITKPIGGFFDYLPVEILGEIFGHCLPPKDRGMPFPLMHEAPLLLCMICVRWRRITMSLPTLWSSFSAEPPRMVDKSSYIPLMGLFLDLSRPHPLSFDIEASNPEEEALVKRSFPKFLSEINRWNDVNLELNETLCQQFLETSLGCGSNLEALCIDTFQCTDEQTRKIPAALNKFPRLCRLKITHTVATSLLELPWSQLTDIYLNAPLPIDECVDALNECSRIVNCTLLHIAAPHNAVKPHKIVLPALTSLKLISMCDVGEILSHLTCPALSHLSIRHRIGHPTRDPKAFNDFCDRSSCELRTFGFLDEEATECDVIRYISTPLLRSLKSLELRGLGASIRTLTMFMHKEGAGGVFMPLLETLKLDVEEVPDDLFCDVVASRWFKDCATAETTFGKRPASLKYVEAWFRRRNRELSPDDIHALREEHVSDRRRFEEFITNGLSVLMRVGGYY